MAQFFLIKSERFTVIDMDDWWPINMLKSWFSGKLYRRMFRYFIICDISNNKKIHVGDRFIAGEYNPPIIFEVLKKIGTSTISARSLVSAPHQKPVFLGKSILLTKTKLK